MRSASFDQDSIVVYNVIENSNSLTVKLYNKYVKSPSSSPLLYYKNSSLFHFIKLVLLKCSYNPNLNYSPQMKLKNHKLSYKGTYFYVNSIKKLN